MEGRRFSDCVMPNLQEINRTVKLRPSWNEMLKSRKIQLLYMVSLNVRNRMRGLNVSSCSPCVLFIKLHPCSRESSFTLRYSSVLSFSHIRLPIHRLLQLLSRCPCGVAFNSESVYLHHFLYFLAHYSSLQIFISHSIITYLIELAGDISKQNSIAFD